MSCSSSTPRPNSKPASLALLRLYLLGPHLGPLHKVPIDKIVRKDIAARLLLASKELGAPTAIALRSAVSSCFTWAMQMGLVDANPVIASFPAGQARSRGASVCSATKNRPRFGVRGR